MCVLCGLLEQPRASKANCQIYIISLLQKSQVSKSLRL